MNFKKINFKKLKKFEWIRTRISLICSPSEKELSKYDIVSSFPNIALQYLRKKGVSTNVHEMNGSLEATIPIIYPMGIDCIETGETLRQNGLKELEIIYDELGLTMISYKNEHINIKIIKALAI